jgi:glycosyltransferase involved in cell wall biosynthesis
MTEPSLVVASSHGAGGASTRVRMLEWLEHLGLRAEVLDYLGTANVRPGTLARRPLGVLRAELRVRRSARGPAPERLLISRSMSPFTRGRVEADLLKRAGWGVYDFDDALFADRRGGIHRYFGEASGWATAMRAADQVIAGNDYLADAAAQHHANVTVIPSCVEPDRYPMKEEYGVGPVPRLVWLGSPTTEPHLLGIAPALLRVHRLTGARLTLISAGDRPLGELEAMTDRIPWGGPRIYELLADADCGIMPLRDDPFARGKCAYKLLQYGAAGLPTVASPVGVNAHVLGQLDGLAATDTASWTDALVQLLREPEARRSRRGLAARRAVVERYSFRTWAPAFRRALSLPEPYQAA